MAVTAESSSESMTDRSSSVFEPDEVAESSHVRQNESPKKPNWCARVVRRMLGADDRTRVLWWKCCAMIPDSSDDDRIPIHPFDESHGSE